MRHRLIRLIVAVVAIGTMYLLEPDKLVLKLVVSAGTLGLLYLIFSTLFQVVLP